MIPALNRMMFNGCPVSSERVICSSHSMPSPWPNQVPSDAGNSRILLAKIAGITPAMLTLRGRWLVCAANTLRPRSEEHTSELQSRENLVCRLLLEKKKQENTQQPDKNN